MSCSFAASWNLFIVMLKGGLLSGPDSCSGVVELQDISWMTGLFPRGPVGTGGAHGDDSPCSEIFEGANI